MYGNSKCDSKRYMRDCKEKKSDRWNNCRNSKYNICKQGCGLEQNCLIGEQGVPGPPGTQLDCICLNYRGQVGSVSPVDAEATGINCDFYLQTDCCDLYKYVDTVGWVNVPFIVEPSLENPLYFLDIINNKIYIITELNNCHLFEVFDGDKLVDCKTGDVFVFENGIWSSNCNIRGLSGETGPIGPTGPPGLIGPTGLPGVECCLIPDTRVIDNIFMSDFTYNLVAPTDIFVENCIIQNVPDTQVFKLCGSFNLVSSFVGATGACKAFRIGFNWKNMLVECGAPVFDSSQILSIVSDGGDPAAANSCVPSYISAVINSDISSFVLFIFDNNNNGIHTSLFSYQICLKVSNNG